MLPKFELGKLAENSNDIICTIDEEGSFVWINRAIEKILGYEPVEVIGRYFLDNVYSEDIEKTKKNTKRLLNGESVQNFVTRYYHKEGSIVSIEWSATWDPSENLLYCIARDNTVLLKTKENYRNLFHQSPLPQYVYDLQTLKFVDMNFAALKLYKYSKKDLSRLTLMNLIPVGEKKKFKKGIKKYYDESEGEVIKFGVSTQIDKEGKQLKIDITGQKIELNGKICAMVIGVDVTDEYRKSNEKQALTKISAIFNRGCELNKTIRKINKYLVDKCEFEFGEVWLQGKENDNIKLINSYPTMLESVNNDEVHDIIQEFRAGVGLPGIISNQKKTIAWDESQIKKHFVRLKAAKKAGLKTVIGVPLYHENKLYGVLLFGSSKRISELDDTIHLFRKLENVLGSEVHRKSLEDDFNRIFETVPDIVCKVDFHSTINRISKAGSEIIGYSEEELRKIKFLDLVYEPDRKMVLNCITNSEELKESFNCEFRVRKKSGDVIWLSWSFRLYDENGVHYAVAKDITKQKEQQFLMDSATNLARVGGWELDLKTNQVYWSPITKKIHGVSPDFEVDFETALNFYRDDIREEVVKIVRKTGETGESWNFEMPIIRANGEECWVKSIGQVIYIDGEPQKIIGSFQDIHERKTIQNEFEVLFNERNRILESISDAFFAVDREWTVTYWNREAEAVLGTKSSEIVGKNLWEVYEDAVDLDFYQQYHKAMKTGKMVGFEEYYPTLDKWFDVTAYPSENGLSIYFRDVSIKKATEESLRTLNKDLQRHAKELSISNAELEQFAYVASHDLQEPLRMVTSFLTQLEKNYKAELDERANKYIEYAVDGAKRMRQIILDLLDFSRVGKNMDHLEVIDLNVLIDEICMMYRKRIDDKSAQIIRMNLPVINSHRTALFQIFQNLISNSIKYAREGEPPRIHITAEVYNEVYQFTISDNGIGIEKDYFEKVFILFQRLHGRDEYSGSGIGLAIVKKWVENLGGHIWLRSKEGEGSTFTFTIARRKQ